MVEVSSEELLLWIQNNNKEEDRDSLYLLVDLLGGISRTEIKNSIETHQNQV